MYADSRDVLDIGNCRPLKLSVATVAVRRVPPNKYLHLRFECSGSSEAGAREKLNTCTQSVYGRIPEYQNIPSTSLPLI